MGILFNLIAIIVTITLISIAYYFTTDHEIIYILKNYNFINDKGTKISYSDFNLVNSFWTGYYGPQNLYTYNAVVNINGFTNKVIITSSTANTATINGINITYDSNKNEMLFGLSDKLITFNDQEIPEVESHTVSHIPETVFINSDGISIPITLISENTWAPKNSPYMLIPKGISTTINNIYRTIFSIPIIVIPVLIDIIGIILI